MRALQTQIVEVYPTTTSSERLKTQIVEVHPNTTLSKNTRTGGAPHYLISQSTEIKVSEVHHTTLYIKSEHCRALQIEVLEVHPTSKLSQDT